VLSGRYWCGAGACGDPERLVVVLADQLRGDLVACELAQRPGRQDRSRACSPMGSEQGELSVVETYQRGLVSS
jgi:hypothetical protein